MSPREASPCVYCLFVRPKLLSFWYIYRRLQRHLPRGVYRTVDIGCGPGSNASAFEGSLYLGLDRDFSRVAFAQQHHPRHRFLRALATSLPFPSGSIEVALICALLHHLDDDQCRLALREASRVLKPSGLLLLFEPLLQEPPGLPDLVMKKLDRGNHIRQRSEYNALLQPRFIIRETETFLMPTLYRCIFFAALKEAL